MPQYRAIHTKDRKVVESESKDVRIEWLTECLTRSPRMEVGIVELKAGATYGDAMSHPGEEIIHVLEGDLMVQLGAKEALLGEGESVTFDSRLKHTVWNPGKRDVRAVFAVSPPNPRLPG